MREAPVTKPMIFYSEEVPWPTTRSGVRRTGQNAAPGRLLNNPPTTTTGEAAVIGAADDLGEDGRPMCGYNGAVQSNCQHDTANRTCSGIADAE